MPPEIISVQPKKQHNLLLFVMTFFGDDIDSDDIDSDDIDSDDIDSEDIDSSDFN
jgi:hypothetical protein